MISKIKNYLNDEKYNIIIKENFTYINNYKKIIDLSENEICIEFQNFKLKIKGKDIKITKLLDKELKFDGIIESINYHYE